MGQEGCTVLCRAGLGRGAHCSRAAMRFLRHRGSSLAAPGHLSPFRAQVTLQGSSLTRPDRPWVHMRGHLASTQPWCDCAIAIPWAADR